MKSIHPFRSPYRKIRAFLLPVAPALPAHLQANFRHLYIEIAWYGLLTGSALSFLTIYAARLGANTTQIGLINAMPAIISLSLALPVGGWLEHRPIDKSVFLGAIGQRIFYLLIVALPWLFNDQMQIWILILFTFLMSIPGAIIAVGFNALFAGAVPMRYRGVVAGRRNAVSAIVTVITSLFCGWILTELSFPIGYQVVFGIGFFGGLMSAIHLWFVHPVTEINDVILDIPIVKATIPTTKRRWELRDFFETIRRRLHTEALHGPFGKSLALLTAFHLVHFLSIPIFPEYMVDTLGLTDQIISRGTALFYITMFLGSTQISHRFAKFGNQKLTAIGICLLGLYPVLLSFARGSTLFYAASFFGGFAWSLVNIGMINYLLEKVPLTNRTGYLAWFTMGTNAAILAGSLLGPVIGNLIGLTTALLIFGILRTSAGLAILKWG